MCKILKLADRIAKWMKIWDSGGGGGLLGGGRRTTYMVTFHVRSFDFILRSFGAGAV